MLMVKGRLPHKREIKFVIFRKLFSSLYKFLDELLDEFLEFYLNL